MVNPIDYKCPITQEPITKWVASDCNGGISKVQKMLMSGGSMINERIHWFEKSSLNTYFKTGGRKCPVCRHEIKSFILYPSKEIKEVKEGKHQVPTFTSIPDVKIYYSLFLIEFAAAGEGIDEIPKNSFIQKIDQTKREKILGKIHKNRAKSLFIIKALRGEEELLRIFKKRLDPQEYKNSVRNLLRDDTTFHFYNVLIAEAFEEAFKEAARMVIGGEPIKRQGIDGKALLIEAERAKKWRAIGGLVFSVVTIFTLARFIFQKCSSLIPSKA